MCEIGKLSRRVHKMGKTGGERLTEKAVWRGSGVCHESRNRQVSTARPPPDMCTALPQCGRRTGADPVSTRSHFHSDNRTISRLQTAHSRCRLRQNWNRAVGLSEPLAVRIADHSPPILLGNPMGPHLARKNSCDLYFRYTGPISAASVASVLSSGSGIPNAKDSLVCLSAARSNARCRDGSGPEFWRS